MLACRKENERDERETKGDQVLKGIRLEALECGMRNAECSNNNALGLRPARLALRLASRMAGVDRFARGWRHWNSEFGMRNVQGF